MFAAIRSLSDSLFATGALHSAEAIAFRALGLNNVRVNNAGCLDRCELGPTMVIYTEGVWYACVTKEDVDEVLDTHLVKGGRVERLMLKPEDK